MNFQQMMQHAAMQQQQAAAQKRSPYSMGGPSMPQPGQQQQMMQMQQQMQRGAPQGFTSMPPQAMPQGLPPQLGSMGQRPPGGMAPQGMPTQRPTFAGIASNPMFNPMRGGPAQTVPPGGIAPQQQQGGWFAALSQLLNRPQQQRPGVPPGMAANLGMGFRGF